MKTGLSTCHGLRSFYARCCCSARSASSACSLSSFAFILTTSAAGLSSISDETPASTSNCILASSRLLYATSAVWSRPLPLSYTARSRQALKASGTPRGTASSWPTQFAAVCMVIQPSTPRKCLHLFRVCLFCPSPMQTFALRLSAILRVLPRRFSPPQLDEIKRYLLF